MKKLRSMLFMPGNNPGMLVSADLLEADAFIYDLEDAVSIKEKDAARDLVSNVLESLNYKNSLVTVRMNPIDSPFWEEDLRAILKKNLNSIIIPKASVEAVKEVENFIINYCKENDLEDQFRFFMLCESASAILDLENIASASDRIDGLLFGGEDYSLDMGVERTKDSVELRYARYRIATVARAYNINAIDTPYTDLDNFAGLKKDTEFSKAIGFNGRLVVGPRQVNNVNSLYSPKKEEIKNSIEILEAAKEAESRGEGVFSFNGKMVDKPVMDRAKKLVESAKEWGLI